MSALSLVTRIDAICRKYDKYDVDKLKEANKKAFSDDAFARLYGLVEAELEEALQKAEAVPRETNRARAVAMKAEIRRSKSRLLDQIPKLQRLAFKKVKGVSKEELEGRNDLALALKERIEGVPDGSTTALKKNPDPPGPSALPTTGIKLSSNPDEKFGCGYFQETKESNKFRQEYEMRKIRQDEGLDVVAEGLDTLKAMAHDMNEEVNRQAVLMDEIDHKVDSVTSDLRNTNVKLKDTVTRLRSSRNFCIDIILLCVILGISAYLYNVLK